MKARTLAKRILTPLIVVGAVVLCSWVSKQFMTNWVERPAVLTGCVDRWGVYHAADVNREFYIACLKERADLFLKADYAEMKDLAKSFLTVLIAMLVASITFSEKIVDLSRAGTWARGLMITSWVAILVAIVACGAGLSFMTVGAGWATYSPKVNYWIFESKAIPLYLLAGVSFGVGLASMLVSGIVSLLHRASATSEPLRPAATTAQEPPINAS